MAIETPKDRAEATRLDTLIQGKVEQFQERQNDYNTRIDALRELLESKIDGFQAAFLEFKTGNADSMHKLNEVRSQLDRQAITFMTKETVEAMLRAYITTEKLSITLGDLIPRKEADSSYISKDAMTGVIATVVTRDMLEQRSRQNLMTASAIAGIIAVVFSVIGTFFPRYSTSAPQPQPVIGVAPPPVSVLPVK
jgi:hypothetical protein